ncbi:hypothetical protein ABPG72_019230 [Tetrahymena utriculariae]
MEQKFKQTQTNSSSVQSSQTNSSAVQSSKQYKKIPVFNPFSRLLLFWEIIEIIAIIILIYAYPHVSFVNIRLNDLMIYLESYIVIFDLIVRINTGYFQRETFVKSSKLIIKKYVSSDFAYDFLGIIAIVSFTQIPENFQKPISIYCFMILACDMFGYSLNQIGRIFEILFRDSGCLRGNIVLMKTYMKQNKAIEKRQQTDFINALPRQIQLQLQVDANRLVLKDVNFLSQNFSEDLLKQAVKIIKELNSTPDEIIFSEGEYSDQNGLCFIEQDLIKVSTLVLMVFLLAANGYVGLGVFGFVLFFILQEMIFYTCVNSIFQIMKNFVSLKILYSLKEITIFQTKLAINDSAHKQNTRTLKQRNTLKFRKTLQNLDLITNHRSNHQRNKNKELQQYLDDNSINSLQDFFDSDCSDEEDEWSSLQSSIYQQLIAEKISQQKILCTELEPKTSISTNFTNQQVEQENNSYINPKNIIKQLSSSKYFKRLIQQQIDNQITIIAQDFDQQRQSVTDSQSKVFQQEQNGQQSQKIMNITALFKKKRKVPFKIIPKVNSQNFKNSRKRKYNSLWFNYKPKQKSRRNFTALQLIQRDLSIKKKELFGITRYAALSPNLQLNQIIYNSQQQINRETFSDLSAITVSNQEMTNRTQIKSINNVIYLNQEQSDTDKIDKIQQTNDDSIIKHDSNILFQINNQTFSAYPINVSTYKDHSKYTIF